MDAPHYLRFVRALALLAGAGCSDNAPPPSTDAAPDLVPDAFPDGATLDMALPMDDGATEGGLDVRSDIALDAVPDLPPTRDVLAEEGSVTPDGSTSPDIPTEAGLCPPTAPEDGSPCTTPMLSCRYDQAGGGFTSCFCVDMGAMRTWDCATAVPGPLPPPEFAVRV